MNKITVSLLIVAMSIIVSGAEVRSTGKNLFNNPSGVFSSLSDSQSVSLSAGMFTDMNRRYSYSMLSTYFKKSINSNISFSYGVDYLRTNSIGNYANGNIGATYQNDRFRVDVYFSKMFKVDETALFSNTWKN